MRILFHGPATLHSSIPRPCSKGNAHSWPTNPACHHSNIQWTNILCQNKMFWASQLEHWNTIHFVELLGLFCLAQLLNVPANVEDPTTNTGVPMNINTFRFFKITLQSMILGGRGRRLWITCANRIVTENRLESLLVLCPNHHAISLLFNEVFNVIN